MMQDVVSDTDSSPSDQDHVSANSGGSLLLALRLHLTGEIAELLAQSPVSSVYSDLSSSHCHSFRSLPILPLEPRKTSIPFRPLGRGRIGSGTSGLQRASPCAVTSPVSALPDTILNRLQTRRVILLTRTKCILRYCLRRLR